MEKKILLFILILSFLGCKKQVIYSPEELTTQQLQKVILENNLKRVIAYKDGDMEPIRVFAENGTKYSFKNGYLTVFDGSRESSYNLAFLIKYNIKELAISNSNLDDKTETSLLLLFK